MTQTHNILGARPLNSSELTVKAQEESEAAEAARDAGDQASARVHEWNARRYKEALAWRLRDRKTY